MPLRHRCEYAAAFPRSLPGSSCPPPREFPAPPNARQVRAASSPDPPGSSWRRIKGMSHAGSSRTPLHSASRTQTIWQCWPVPALSGLLPPSPAPPGSGCPQLHRPAATGSAAKVSHLPSNHSASRRTHDLRHTAASAWLGAGADPKVVQRVLGHASAAMTMDLYGHLIDRNLWDAADRFGGTTGASSDEGPEDERGTLSGSGA
jgi:hypothetical protein